MIDSLAARSLYTAHQRGRHRCTRQTASPRRLPREPR